MTLEFSDDIAAGTVMIVSDLESQNYQQGVSGWAIFANGNAEFNDGTFRGQLTAGSITAGSIGSSTIVASDFQNGTIEDSVITFDNGNGALFCYETTVVTTTRTTSGTFNVPAGITSLSVNALGGGGGGQGGSGAAGGGGEYAAATVPVTPGETLTVTIGTGGLGGTTANNGAGGAGLSSTLSRAGVALLEAHGGAGGATGYTVGGTGSAASTHFDGGSSPGNFLGTGSGGSGGGSSAGTMTAGTAGHPNAGATGGAGGAAPTGGGAGGAGGAAVGTGAIPGTIGSVPGGGGGSGGLGTVAGANGGAGARGQMIITYTSATPTLIASVAPQAGVDQYGHAYPEGFSGTFVAVSNLLSANQISTNYITAGNDIYGTFSSTGSGTAGTVTTAVVFPQALVGTTFTVFIEPATQLLGGVNVIETGAINITSAGFTGVVQWGTSTTPRTFMYHAHGV